MKNILLDTHTLIWYLQGNEKSGEINKTVIENPENNKFLSLASIWEMALKINSGKLEHIFQLQQIPFHHKDPFDRLIISTSMIENLTIMSVDENFNLYNVNLIWNDKSKERVL